MISTGQKISCSFEKTIFHEQEFFFKKKFSSQAERKRERERERERERVLVHPE